MSAKQQMVEQPKSFEFTSQNLAWAKEQIAKYPEGKQASAIIPLLWRAQEQHDGWLPQPAIDYLANLLDMAPIRVMEVVTFYTMFNRAPVGKYFVQLCGTTPCLLRGSDELVDVLKKRIGQQRHVTEDGLFSWLEVECLGACANAPMVQINQDYFEDLTAEKFTSLLDDLEAGRDVTPGPQNGRSCSCPDGGATSLTDASLYAASEDVASAGVATVGAASIANFVQNSVQTGDVVKSQAAAEKIERKMEDLDDAFPPTGGKQKARPASAISASAISGSATSGSAPAGAVDGSVANAQDKDAPEKNDLKTSSSDGVPTGQSVEIKDEDKPEGLSGARDGAADDLKKISGVGPKLEGTLNSLGVYHFDQIADWNRENVAWVDNFLSFKGRIDREDWIEQARILAKATDIQKLVDDKKGDA